MTRSPLLACLCLLFNFAAATAAQPRIVVPEPVHLRDGDPREWSEFSEQPVAGRLSVEFNASANTHEQTLQVRQHDVKQNWVVRINDHDLGRLRVDENPMLVYFDVPAGVLREGANTLTVSQEGRKTPDDIEVGPVAVIAAPVQEVLSAGRLQVTVTDAATGEAVPSRITILTADGDMASVWAEPIPTLAVRPGIVYTSTGTAEVGLPPGEYTIHAGRGFEWSLATENLIAEPDRTVRLHLAIQCDVPTPGYVACDTHVHTLTHSGHGDATIEERMVTIAAEGIELPVATDHNKHIDYEETARQVGVNAYFTPVVGNEVTTPTGHFNVFPTPPGGPVPNHKQREWGLTFEAIFSTPGVRAVVLNHARDIHYGTRPFGPKLFNATTGQSLEERPYRFHAMELVNSGAVQTDTLQLYRDWFALLNRGLKVTPVGGSDSHDVGRHFVGQARTYIRCADDVPGRIDAEQAIGAFLEGRVLVSYGLLADVIVDGKYQSGDLASGDGPRIAKCRVLGPSWSTAQRFALYANGRIIREFEIEDGDRPGVKWERDVELPPFAHDVHLVGVAVGPGIRGLHWPTAKPYQPDSPVWTGGTVIGSTGAIWIDADGDRRFTSAREYAARLVAESPHDAAAVLKELEKYDTAVAAHAAALLDEGGKLSDEQRKSLLDGAASAVREGFGAYFTARRDSELARLQQ